MRPLSRLAPLFTSLLFAFSVGSAASRPRPPNRGPAGSATTPPRPRPSIHASWTEFLQTYVAPDADGLHRVAYGRVTSADRRALDAYLRELQAVRVSGLARDEQRAFWTNLYNAVTVDVISTTTPVESIMDVSISPGFFSRGPWGKKLVRVEGVELSLDDIEHRILRPVWNDPRTHYAVNCASVGCPNLLTEAFTPRTSSVSSRRPPTPYVNHPRAPASKEATCTSPASTSGSRRTSAAPRRASSPTCGSTPSPASPARSPDGRDRDDWSLNDASGRR